MVESKNLTTEEIDKINQNFNNFNSIDETIKQRQFNIDKLQEFKKVIYKTKKNRKKIFNLKRNRPVKEKIHETDPYKFKCIPKNIKEIMKNLLLEYDTSLQTVSYKTNIPLYKLQNFIYKKFSSFDNVDLHKFLKYFNYNLN